jgi:hypothetical protein
MGVVFSTKGVISVVFFFWFFGGDGHGWAAAALFEVAVRVWCRVAAGVEVVV